MSDFVTFLKPEAFVEGLRSIHSAIRTPKSQVPSEISLKAKYQLFITNYPIVGDAQFFYACELFANEVQSREFAKFPSFEELVAPLFERDVVTGRPLRLKPAELPRAPWSPHQLVQARALRQSAEPTGVPALVGTPEAVKTTYPLSDRWQIVKRNAENGTTGGALTAAEYRALQEAARKEEPRRACERKSYRGMQKLLETVMLEKGFNSIAEYNALLPEHEQVFPSEEWLRAHPKFLDENYKADYQFPPYEHDPSN